MSEDNPPVRARQAANSGTEPERQRRLDQLESLFDALPVLVSRIGPDHRYRYNNRAYEQWVGIPQAELAGMHMRDVLGEELYERIRPMVDNALGGRPSSFEGQVTLPTGEQRHVRADYLPDRAAGEPPTGVFALIQDISLHRQAEAALERSEDRLKRVLETEAVGVIFFNQDGVVIGANDAFLEMTGYSRSDIASGTLDWRRMTPPEWVAASEAQMEKLEKTGRIGPYEKEYILADGSRRWMLFAGRDLGDGTIAEYCIDVTHHKKTQTALEDSERRFRVLFEKAGVGMVEIDSDWRIVSANEAYCHIAGRGRDELMGLSCLAFTHPDDRQTSEAMLENVSGPGPDAISFEKRYVRPDGSIVWIRSNLTRVEQPGGANHFLKIVEDITDAKAAELALSEAQEELRKRGEEFYTLADNIPVLAWMAYADGHIFWYNSRWYEYTGTSAETQEGWGWESVHDPAVLQDVVKRWRRSIATGERFEMTFPLRGADGQFRPFLTRVVPVRDGEGKIVRWFGTNVDVSDRVRAEEQLREEGHTLETLNRVGSSLAGELDLERVVQMVTDAGVELTGAEFGAFFYNVVNAAGECLMLYTLSGAERAQFEKFGMPRNTKVFAPTFAGEGIVRSDDITKDPRYGRNPPHQGMPEGHLPVVSYLAVPVIGRTGEVIGGLFFGHPAPGRFKERHERLMRGIAAQAAIAIDNARLFRAAQREIEQRVKAEEALTALNETLESRVAEEIDRRSHAEEALRQAQKMETVGQLSGGIAHDFNNLLQVIHGNLTIMQRSVASEETKLHRTIANALSGTERAAALTQRLLAFSRRQPLDPKPVDVNRMIGDMTELLRRTLGEHIQVETRLAADLPNAHVDANQLENAILNLAINSRDAMPDGGTLSIETRLADVDRAYAELHPDAEPGSYVRITVSDTGVGMSPEIAKRAVEPFFTTKEVGQGTGLGLSMVYGFLKQSGGHLELRSTEGVGTAVDISLPCSSASAEEPLDKSGDGGLPLGKGERILVCEDDADVRRFSTETLADLGYLVEEAGDADSALDLLDRGGPVDLLFTDIVLPGGKTGADLARAARERQPGLKVLFTTGYARTALDNAELSPALELISKPFSVEDLARRLRQMLDQR